MIINGERALAYVVNIDAIEPIVGSDNCEAAVVGGWKIMTRKGTFKAGDAAVYFEIDSCVDVNKPEFAFMARYKGAVKTQKYTFGGKNPGFFSQGLLMSFDDFGWSENTHKVNDDVTKELGVTYYTPGDNQRKATSADKYKIMAQRMGKKAAKNPYRWLLKRNWGKKLLYIFFGKGSKKKEWPDFVRKTDEERVQNLVPMIPSFREEKWIPTEKVDGTSTTFAMRKKDFYVCSRNVVMNLPGKEKTCYYAETDGNVYTEMAHKYDMKSVLSQIKKTNDLNYVVIQAETYGGSIQKRNYHLKNHDMCVFNVIFGYKDGTEKRLNPFEGKALMDSFNIPYVPIVCDEAIDLPETCEDILAYAHGDSKIDGDLREGIVWRSIDGVKSFKSVDNAFLLKYHG